MTPRTDSNAPRLRQYVWASVAGNLLEWYDFFLYGLTAALVLGELFFPPEKNPLIGTMAAFGTFAVGYAARPVGALIFGHLGDRIGRQPALVITLLMMGISTTIMGLLPTYASIGLWAPLALVILRIVQGIAAGGEWGGGVLLISENVDRKRRGFSSALSQTGVSLGFVLAAGVFLIVRQMPTEVFMTWGWRVPFLASILIVAVGLYIRLRLPENASFRELQAEEQRTGRQERSKLPIVDAFRHSFGSMLVGMGIRIAEGAGSYIFLVFALTYGKSIGLSPNILLAAVMVSMVVDAIDMAAYGRLSDKIGRRPVYLIGSIGLMVYAFPFFYLLSTGNTVAIFAAFIIANGLVHAAMIGVQPALYTELFGTKVRYSGIAVGREIASILGGGIAPLVATALFNAYKSPYPVSWYLIAMGLVTTIAVVASRCVRTHEGTLVAAPPDRAIGTPLYEEPQG
ncbi:MAG TPA: MFS transporter [Nevskiaceae bacterium]